MMELTLKEKQEILEKAPEWATDVMEPRNFTPVKGKKIEYARLCSGEYFDSKVNRTSFCVDKSSYEYWDVKYSLSDLRKEIEREEQMKIVEAVNNFETDDPSGSCGVFEYDNVAFSIKEYDECIKELSEAAWLNKEAPGESQYYDAYKRAYNDMQAAETVKWKNGDECIYRGDKCLFVGMMPVIPDNYRDGLDCLVQLSDCGVPMTVESLELKKPETAEQKAERELHEQVCAIMKSWGHEPHEYNENRNVSITYAAAEQMLEDGYKLPE